MRLRTDRHTHTQTNTYPDVSDHKHFASSATHAKSNKLINKAIYFPAQKESKIRKNEKNLIVKL